MKIRILMDKTKIINDDLKNRVSYRILVFDKPTEYESGSVFSPRCTVRTLVC